jgi:hypothetical protein
MPFCEPLSAGGSAATGAFPNQTGSSSATIAYTAATGAMRWITVNGSQFMDSPQNMTLAPNVRPATSRAVRANRGITPTTSWPLPTRRKRTDRPCSRRPEQASALTSPRCISRVPVGGKSPVEVGVAVGLRIGVDERC